MKQNWDLREAHEKSLNDMEELQNEMNCMNDSRDFQDAESVRSGQSHVTSQPVFFPPHPDPGGMLSRSTGMPSRNNGPPSIFGTRMVFRETFLQIQRRLLQHFFRKSPILGSLMYQIKHTCEHKQYCHVGNTAKQCRLGLFQDSDFAGDLEDSKSTSGGTLCIFGSRTFVPMSWMCKKRTAVSHSSTEAEIISRDAGLRMEGIPALDLWDLVGKVFQTSPKQTNKTRDPREPQGNLSANPQQNMRKQIPTTHTDLDLINIDHVPSNGAHFGPNAMLYAFL